MILGKQIEMIYRGEKLAGTITEVTSTYCIVTNGAFEQFKIGRAEVPPTHREWSYKNLPWRAADMFGQINYFAMEPVISGSHWSVSHYNLCDKRRSAGYYNGSWDVKDFMNSLQHISTYNQIP
jgi:hypothetical protein